MDKHRPDWLKSALSPSFFMRQRIASGRDAKGSWHPRMMAARHLSPERILSCEPGLHNGRHAGLRRAKADVLIFADDDVEAEPTWVEAVLEIFQNPEIALVGGNNYPNFEVDPPAWLLHWWQQPKGRGRALNSLSILDFGGGVFDMDPGYVWGCNFSIRRDVLLKARGFHPDGFPLERILFRGDGETYVPMLFEARACGPFSILGPAFGISFPGTG